MITISELIETHIGMKEKFGTCEFDPINQLIISWLIVTNDITFDLIKPTVWKA
jgi:hypothetical protein